MTAPTVRPRRRERLLLVGLASCDSIEVERLLAAGRMPNLANLKATGASGRLTVEEPPLPPALWTTLATGRHSENHRVLVQYAPRQDGGGVAITGRSDWQAPAFWQLLEAARRRTLTIGWPVTGPATSWAGIHVDARFAAPTGPDFATWAMPPDCVSPDTLRPALRELRVHPADVTGPMLAPFVPELRQVDQYRDARLTRLAAALARASTVHAAATELIGSQDWDTAAVHYDMLDCIHQHFDGVRAEPLWARVMDEAYSFADAMLGRLMQLAGPDTTVWVVSPNGVRRDARARGVARWRPSGWIAARGRWIDPGSQLPAARLIDIAPSLLARFGLTAEMDGKVLPALAPGATRRPVSASLAAMPEADRHVATLRTLGYDDAPSPEQARALFRSAQERSLALGEALLGRGRVRDADAVLQQALRDAPGDASAIDPDLLRRLALCRVMLGDADGCRTLGAELRRIAPQQGWGDLVIAAGFGLDGKAQEAWPHMAAASEKGGHDPEFQVRLGGVALMLGEDGSASTHFRRALALDPDLPAAEAGLVMAAQLAARTSEESSR